jgi:streptogramin lyase
VQPNKVVRFQPSSGQFSSFDIPTAGATPVGIAADRQDNVWLAEAVGKIAKINITSGEIKEYAPPGQRQLDEPTAVFPDPKSNVIYISEHTGHTITAFNPLLGTFREYPSVNEGGLPFGMAMDSYGNLWYAQHEIDRIAVIDPRTGAGAEAKIPITGSFIQWITADDKGKIWFAAQRGDALGSITITSKSVVPPADNGSGGPTDSNGPAINLGFSFTDIAGPAIAAGVVISALFYAKSSVDLRRNTRAAQKLG